MKVEVEKFFLIHILQNGKAEISEFVDEWEAVREYLKLGGSHDENVHLLVKPKMRLTVTFENEAG